MLVRTYRGAAKSAYRIVIPLPGDLSEMSEKVQAAAKNLGGLVLMQEHELRPDDPFHQTLLKQIETEGAAIWKVDIQFNEIVG
jgi:hypothetical protein